ncbi:hypothetical protein JW935_13595 [candidate division KSB1 bacterium]|nr:hypothetical protein [candidate division KSB1 bacterium]
MQLKIEEPPKGFTVSKKDNDTLRIVHTRTGMGCMNTFLSVWLGIWTIFCIWLLYDFFTGGSVEGEPPPSPWLVVIFWFFEFLVAGLLIFLFFCKKQFLFSAEELVMETQILGLRNRQIIPRQTITHITQIKDGGEDDDSFPSWGLLVEGPKPGRLIYRQPPEVSSWLGNVVARWAGVEFSEHSDYKAVLQRLQKKQNTASIKRHGDRK